MCDRYEFMFNLTSERSVRIDLQTHQVTFDGTTYQLESLEAAKNFAQSIARDDRDWQINTIDLSDRYPDHYRITGINCCAKDAWDRFFIWQVKSFDNKRYFFNSSGVDVSARALERLLGR